MSKGKTRVLLDYGIGSGVLHMPSRDYLLDGNGIPRKLTLCGLSLTFEPRIRYEDEVVRSAICKRCLKADPEQQP